MGRHWDDSQGGRYADEDMPLRSLDGALAELAMGDADTAAVLLEVGMVVPLGGVDADLRARLEKALYLQGLHLHGVRGGWEVRADRSMQGVA